MPASLTPKSPDKSLAKSPVSDLGATSAEVQPLSPTSAVAIEPSLATAWWSAPWQTQSAWAESYWQAWHTMAWMPWNMVLSAWQMADSYMPSTEPPRGLWHSAMGQPQLGCTPPQNR